MQLEIEREAIRRERDKTKESQLSRDIAELSEERNALKAKWESEKSVVVNIRKEKESIDRLKYEAEQAEKSRRLRKRSQRFAMAKSRKLKNG